MYTEAPDCKSGAFSFQSMNVRGLLIDLDGTLYREDGQIPGTGESLSCIEAAGITYRYVTNTTRKPQGEVVSRLRELGFPAWEDLVFTPAVAANILLQGRRCYALVAEALLEDLSHGCGVERLRTTRGRSGR